MNMMLLRYIYTYIFEMYISYLQTNKITQDSYIPIILGAVISQRVVGLKKIFISANPFPVEFSFVNNKLFWGTEQRKSWYAQY